MQETQCHFCQSCMICIYHEDIQTNPYHGPFYNKYNLQKYQKNEEKLMNYLEKRTQKRPETKYNI